MILAGVVNDVFRDFLLVSEYSLVVLEGGEVAVHHLSVVPHTDLVKLSGKF